MIHITPQERLCVIVFFLIVFSGLLLNVTFKKYPHISNIINVVDDEYFYPKIDVNLATTQELKDLPGIGKYTAQAIISYREQVGIIASLDEVKNIPGVYSKNFNRFKPYLKVHHER